MVRTDALGRDVLSQLIHGARVSLLIGLVSTLAALAIGVPVGAVAGYFPGWPDDLLMRFTEFFQTIPSFALAIVLLASGVYALRGKHAQSRANGVVRACMRCA